MGAIQGHHGLMMPGLGAATDPSYSSVSLLLHGDGANGGTTFADNSPSPKTPTRFGNVVTSTAQSMFGGASIYWDGTGDALLYAYAASLHLSGDFTIEFWIYPTATGGNVLNHGGGVGVAWASYTLAWAGSTLIFAGSSANAGYDIGTDSVGSPTTIGTPTLNAWNHVAITRSGNVYRGFLDGVLGFSQTYALSPYSPTPRGLTVGGGWSGTYGTGTPVGVITAYIDDLRITKGVARYTSNFTPPTAPFPNS